MAKFEIEVPKEIMDELKSIENNTEQIFGEMTKAGAEVVEKNIRKNIQGKFKDTSSILKGLKITKVYKTPSDDGINTKVAFYGYTEDGTPIPLIVNAREYGTSRGEAKKPFVRTSFKKSEIEEAMKKVQEKYIKED